MVCRPLEITIISAKGLEKVKHLSKMDVYVIATISGDPKSEQVTPIAKDGGTSPKWNSSMKFSINESSAQTITFRVRCSRQIRGDKDIGEVHVSIKELTNAVDESNTTKYATYPVMKPSGKQKGELNFLFKFGDKFNINVDSVVTAYPYPSQSAGVTGFYPPAVGYPPNAGGYPPNAGGYMVPSRPPQPPAGYPQSGLGYVPPVVQPAPQDNGIGGSALDAAFLGGLLGGFVIGQMVSSEAVNYDAAGFQDGHGGGDCGY